MSLSGPTKRSSPRGCLPSRLIVLGGGPIGLEIAQAFGRLGSKVIIVEFMDQILGPEDRDLADILRTRLEEEGNEIHVSTKALKVEMRGSTFLLTVAPASGEGQSRVIEGDALFIATGRKPNIEGLGLEAAGVTFTPRAIPTDERMRTNVRHIYACGDVNGQFPFTHVAGYEAGIALTNAILHLPRKADYGKIGWCTYTDPEVASIGLNEKRAKKEGVEYRIKEEPFERERSRPCRRGDAGQDQDAREPQRGVAGMSDHRRPCGRDHPRMDPRRARGGEAVEDRRRRTRLSDAFRDIEARGRQPLCREALQRQDEKRAALPVSAQGKGLRLPDAP